MSLGFSSDCCRPGPEPAWWPSDPDKAQDTDREEAEARFKKLTAAYTLLSDPAKRQKFDAGEPGNSALLSDSLHLAYQQR